MTSVSFISSCSIGTKEKKILRNLQFSASGTRRICLHSNEDALLHVMLIELAPEITFPKHKHTDSDEITILINGQMMIEYWLNKDDESKFKLNLDKRNRVAFIESGKFHSNSSGKNGCLYLEVKRGPFNPKNMIVDDQ